MPLLNFCKVCSRVLYRAINVESETGGFFIIQTFPAQGSIKLWLNRFSLFIKAVEESFVSLFDTKINIKLSTRLAALRKTGCISNTIYSGREGVPALGLTNFSGGEAVFCA